MQRPERQPYTSPRFPPADGLKFAVAALRVYAHLGTAMMQYQIEGLTFLKQRFEQDLKWINAVSEGEDLADSFDLLGEFFQNATADYATEAGRIAGVGSKIATDTARRLRKHAEAVVEGMALRTVA